MLDLTIVIKKMKLRFDANSAHIPCDLLKICWKFFLNNLLQTSTNIGMRLTINLPMPTLPTLSTLNQYCHAICVFSFQDTYSHQIELFTKLN